MNCWLVIWLPLHYILQTLPPREVLSSHKSSLNSPHNSCMHSPYIVCLNTISIWLKNCELFVSDLVTLVLYYTNTPTKKRTLFTQIVAEFPSQFLYPFSMHCMSEYQIQLIKELWIMGLWFCYTCITFYKHIQLSSYNSSLQAPLIIPALHNFYIIICLNTISNMCKIL